jgi:hypothetical protein
MNQQVYDEIRALLEREQLPADLPKSLRQFYTAKKNQRWSSDPLKQWCLGDDRAIYRKKGASYKKLLPMEEWEGTLKNIVGQREALSDLTLIAEVRKRK